MTNPPMELAVRAERAATIDILRNRTGHRLGSAPWRLRGVLPWRYVSSRRSCPNGDRQTSSKVVDFRLPKVPAPIKVVP